VAFTQWQPEAPAATGRAGPRAARFKFKFPSGDPRFQVVCTVAKIAAVKNLAKWTPAGPTLSKTRAHIGESGRPWPALPVAAGASGCH
jgi:hypothetical protein